MALSDHITRTNTILYCERWSESVDFYRDTLGFAVTHTTDWFVELHLTEGSHLSVADSSRATIPPAGGAGITLSWKVDDLGAARAHLVGCDVTVSEPRTRWGSRYVEFHDPENNRIELWCDAQ